MKVKKTLAIDEAQELLSYDPKTGNLIWKVDRGGTAKTGMVAGHRDTSHGYRIIRVNGIRYRAHRIAWLLFYREFPTSHIDHINRNRDDNRITNLRCVTHTENMRNRKKMKSNKSGVTGVSWNSKDKNWKAQITSNGKRIILGCRANIDDAIELRRNAEIKFNFHPNHGKTIDNDNIPLPKVKQIKRYNTPTGV